MKGIYLGACRVYHPRFDLDYVTTKKISFKKGVVSKIYKVTNKVYIQKYFESPTDFYPYGAKAYFYLNQLKGSK